MKNILKINCQRVFDSGNLYVRKDEELVDLQNKLKNISKEIENAWEGPDSHNFVVSLNHHIENINLIIDFLSNNGDIMKQCAQRHNLIDDDMADGLERSDIDVR